MSADELDHDPLCASLKGHGCHPILGCYDVGDLPCDCGADESVSS